MKKLIILLLSLISLFFVSFYSVNLTATSSTLSKISTLETFSSKIEGNHAAEIMQKLPHYFVENKGQVEEAVHYQIKLSGMSAYFTSREIVYQVLQREKEKTRVKNIRMTFVEINEEVEVTGGEENEGKVNYFRGNDPGNWIQGAKTFRKVIYKELYPDIDLIVYGDGGKIKHEYRARAGAKVEDIRIKYEGIKGLSVNEDGELEVVFDGGELREGIPISYQRINGKKVEVQSAYRLMGDNVVGFNIGEYEQDRELIIDPDLSYATYVGGSTSGDAGHGIAVDGAGNVFITGLAISSDFPTTPGAYDTTYNGGGGDTDVFIAKLNSTGTALIYSTYLGGSSNDTAWGGITIDGSGNAYITGYTGSANFPTTSGAYNTSLNGNSDVFITKLDPSGSALVYSTFLGGTSADVGYGIARDGTGNIYVTGYTDSTDFPTTFGAYDTSHTGIAKVFITKLNTTGTALVYSTFLGGTGGDYGTGIAVDGDGDAYVTGYTFSADFPTTPGAYDTSHNGGNADGFITEFDSTGSALSYSTFLGGSSWDECHDLVVDESGNAYITGKTESSDFPTTAGAYDTSHNGGVNDIFITKLNPSGSALIYSTFLGGSHAEVGYGIAIDGSENACVTGFTWSTDFPTTADAYDKSHNSWEDVFMTKLNSAGSALNYSTYLGGSNGDNGYGIAVDVTGNSYVTGSSWSADFPTTPGVFDTSHNGGDDVIVAKFKLFEDPDINVKVLGMSISDGATFDFGTLSLKKIVKGPIPFIIQNLGAGPLLLTGSPDKVYLTGMAAGYFYVSQQPSSPVAPGGSTIFRIKCIYDSVPGWIPPGWQKKISFTVNIPNNDPDENPYDFVITGNVKN